MRTIRHDRSLIISDEFADVVVVGGGTLGLLTAARLLRSGLVVHVLELGGGTHAGDPPHDVSLAAGSSYRGFTEGASSGWGGTSQLWGGQLWSWDASEFLPRPSLGLPGWPLRSSDIEPYYEQVLAMLKAGPQHLRPHSSTFPSGDLPTKYSTWLPIQRRNFWHVLKADLISAPRCSLTADARVHAIDRDEAENRWRIEAVVGGARVTLRAEQVVLAAGTAGNVELVSSSGLSSSPWLGRGLMDHLSARVATVDIWNYAKFRASFAPRYEGPVLVTPRLLVGLERGDELGAYCHFEIDQCDGDSVDARKRIANAVQARRMPARRDIWKGGGPLALEAASRILMGRRLIPSGGRVYLRVDVEQPPRFTSKLSLLDKELHASWDLPLEETQHGLKVAQLIGQRLLGGDFGVRRLDWEENVKWRDIFHVMGGLRMDASPLLGVVDPLGEVHNASGIFVVGASIFPEGGMANPTFLALALALRTVDHMTANASPAPRA